jgi:hypothetical protein
MARVHELLVQLLVQGLGSHQLRLDQVNLHFVKGLCSETVTAVNARHIDFLLIT